MHKIAALALFATFVAVAAHAQPNEILARWVQMAPGGVAEARVAIRDNVCPTAVVDDKIVATQLRAGSDDKFPVRLCAISFPLTVRSVSIMGQAVPVPKVAPKRIIVFGDTGCRVNPNTIQDCNDPKGWPFPEVAAQAAKLKPDLVIHVGDYLYREYPCPNDDARCVGSPSGDKWDTWAADFFTPGKPLLAAAPWVIVRGNHEECRRSGAGFLRLLGPFSFAEDAPCAEHVAPYAVPLGDFDLVVMDNASAIDCCVGVTKALCWFSCGPSSDLVDTYQKDFAELPKLSARPMWIAMHHPIWGVTQLRYGMTGCCNATLVEAEKDAGLPPNLDLMLAGHIHTFEAINYEKGLPPQLIVGEGGDRLDKAPPDLTGDTVFTAKIADGFSLPGYGFLLLTRGEDHWQVDVFDASGAKERTCAFAERRLSCPAH